MKKVLMILGVVLMGLTSCKKEDEMIIKEHSVKLNVKYLSNYWLSGCRLEAKIENEVYDYYILDEELFYKNINLKTGDIIELRIIGNGMITMPFPNNQIIISGCQVECVSNEEVIKTINYFNLKQEKDTTYFNITIQ